MPTVLPSIAHLNNFRDSERERSHEVIPGSTIPVPDLDEQSTILVLRLQFTGKDSNAYQRYGRKRKAITHLQEDGLVPHRIQRRPNSLGFLLDVIRIGH